MSSVVQPAAAQIHLNVVRWIGFKTIVIREWGRIIRIWGQTIVPSVVTSVLYFAIFGSLIGRRVGAMDGLSRPASPDEVAATLANDPTPALALPASNAR